MKCLPCVITLVLGAVGFCAQEQNSLNRKPVLDPDALDQLAQQELAERKIPGAALAIVSGDRVIYSKGFGVTNAESPTPVTTDTIFMIRQVWLRPVRLQVPRRQFR